MTLRSLLSLDRAARALRFAFTLGLLLPAAALPLSAADESFVGPLSAGTFENTPRKETSGLVVSRRSPDVVWMHDDSGGAPELYARDLITGKTRGTVRVTGVKNEDWEDIAAFERDGKAWLLIGDVGDNDAQRKTVRLHVLEEPYPAKLSPDAALEVAPAYTLRFRYSDGPRDCESVAVDGAEGAVYLLSKRDSPPQLYRLPLANPGGKVAEAQLLGPVPAILSHTPIDALIKRIVGRKFSWPTAMDFSPNGRMAVVLTYGEPLVFARESGEPWADAFARPPLRLLFPGLPQAEAVAFSADSRTIYVASEETNVLIRYNLEAR